MAAACDWLGLATYRAGPNLSASKREVGQLRWAHFLSVRLYLIIKR